MIGFRSRLALLTTVSACAVLAASAASAQVASPAADAPVATQSQAQGADQPIGRGVGQRGTIRGRVLNTATGEYVKDADVRVAGTDIATTTTAGGYFILPDVPAGPATIITRYTGLQDASVDTAIAGGTTTQVAVEMKAQSVGDNAVTGIVVSAVRSATAAALAKERTSLNAVVSVDANTFGTVTMNDVGEFMKNMPGVALDYNETDASSVRISGLDPKYSLFTTDGTRMATATSNFNTGRANSFEQMTSIGVSRIELNNTLLASMDADAPGGTINLVSKYAFERSRRQFDVQLGGVASSYSGTSDIYLPDDKKHQTIYPSGQLTYGDVFLGGKLGFEVNAAYTANFVETNRLETDWNYAPGSSTPLPYQNTWRPGPKYTDRVALTTAVDYRVNDNLTLSLHGTFSDYSLEYFNLYTTLAYTPGPGSTPTHIVVPSGGSLTTDYSHRYANAPEGVFTPKIEWKGDTFEADLRGGYAFANYDFRDGTHGFFQRNDDTITGLGFTMNTPSQGSTDVTLAQTAGPSWSNANNWHMTSPTARIAQSTSTDEQYSLNMDLKKKFAAGPVQLTLMGGGEVRTNDWTSNEGAYKLYQYVGPNGNPLAVSPPATQNYQWNLSGANFGNVNSLGWRADSNYGLYSLLQSNPSWFIPDTIGNLTRQYTNTHEVAESIGATYLELQGQWEKLRFDLGVRYEATDEDATTAQARTAAQMKASGLTPNTVAYVNYQYYNGQQAYNKSDYGNVFFSGGLKYDLTQKLVGSLSFSQAILRPDYGNLGGAYSVNETTSQITLPNPLLKPETSNKYWGSLQYFLEPSGIIGISVFRMDIKDLQTTGVAVSPNVVGLNAADYPGYSFISTINSPGTTTNSGIVLQYDQQLVFLPGLLKGFGLRGSWTGLDFDGVRVNTPHYTANWGIRYSKGPFDIQLMGAYQSSFQTSALGTTPTTASNGIIYHADRTLWNLGATYNVSPGFTLGLSGRNITNSHEIWYSDVRSRINIDAVMGSLWEFTATKKF